MPNWCSNTITINNLSREQVRDLMKYISDNEGRFFQYFKPRPQSEANNWYDWNTKNWGTKWDACETHISEIHKDKIVIMFESAWAPPIHLYETMHRNGYSFTASYSEPMMGFAGLFNNGIDTEWLILREEA